VRSMDNTIGFKLSSMGVGDNPQMRHQARLFAADAVKKFKPDSGASLSTWTQNQLQSMQRFKRENQGPVKVSDRSSLDAWTIEKGRRDLEDELGRDPDVKQLADKTGLSVKRIATVRKATRPVAATEQMHTEGIEMSDFLGEALEYVYDESDYVDKKIIEMTTGYGGSPMMQQNAIASKLGMSASQISRRAERLGMKVQELNSDMEGLHS